jgi:hypothetical protein
MSIDAAFTQKYLGVLISMGNMKCANTKVGFGWRTRWDGMALVWLEERSNPIFCLVRGMEPLCPLFCCWDKDEDMLMVTHFSLLVSLLPVHNHNTHISNGTIEYITIIYIYI